MHRKRAGPFGGLSVSTTIEIFLLILSASFVFTTLLSRVPLLRIPSAVGYLLFGVVLHLHVFASRLSAEDQQWLTQLGFIGLLFLMFISGLEVDLNLLRLRRVAEGQRHPLLTAANGFLATLLMSYLVAWFIAWRSPEPVNPWMLTLLFATTSLGVIVPILEESDRLHTPFGQVLLLYALLADMCTMLLLSLFLSTRRSGDATDFFLTLVVLPLSLAAYAVLRWLRRFPRARRLAGDVSNRTRGAVALVAAFAAVAEFSGSEPILGSFLVGIIVSALPFAWKRRVKETAHGIGYGLLIPIFFISVGMNFNLAVLEQFRALLWVPVLLGAAFVTKLIPAWRMARPYGRRAALAGGFLLSARLSLVVAAADIGVRVGALPEVLSEAVVIVAVITCLCAPILFVFLADTAAH